MHRAVHILGTDSGNGAYYLFYSGAFTVLCVIAGQLWNGYLTSRKNNCHEHGCWRIGRLPVDGTPWHVCRRHHPAPPQRGDIREHYHLYLGRKPGRG